MFLRVILDNGEAPVVERDDGTPFATWSMMLVNEGFTLDDAKTYIPGNRIVKIQRVDERIAIKPWTSETLD